MHEFSLKSLQVIHPQSLAFLKKKNGAPHGIYFLSAQKGKKMYL